MEIKESKIGSEIDRLKNRINSLTAIIYTVINENPSSQAALYLSAKMNQFITEDSKLGQ